MSDFRIIPKQAAMRSTSGPRGFGFIFEGQVLCWPTFQTAKIAAFMLQVPQDDIVPVGVLIAEMENDQG